MQKARRESAWRIAAGLQAVDGLEPSETFWQLAQKNIDGRITFSQAEDCLKEKYRKERPGPENRTWEADRAACRMASLLMDDSFQLSAAHFLGLHRKIFQGILPSAGTVRTYGISKAEQVLDGASVSYGIPTELAASLEYDLEQERQFSYRLLDEPSRLAHLSSFIAGLWQIHPFGEGNTRTTALFLLQYLRKMGFEWNAKPFAESSLYFRNALVRANYEDASGKIHCSTRWLEAFLHNLVLQADHPLNNEALCISADHNESIPDC